MAFPGRESSLHPPTSPDAGATPAGPPAPRATGPQPSRLLEILLRLPAFQSLRHREFRLLWYGQTFVSLGTWMDEVTRGWLMYELTNSAVQLGLVRGIQVIPMLVLSPFAGSAADRYSRKAQLVASQIANGLIYAVTALLIVTGRIRPWHVYVTAFLMAAVQTFQQPARAALVCDAVPPGSLTNAIGLNAMIYNMARSAGPALAGGLIVLSGTGGAYFVQGIFFFLATLWTVRVRLEQRPGTPARDCLPPRESFGQSIMAGWKFSWRQEAVRAGLTSTMIASLFLVPFTTLLPVFARDLLGVGAEGQGLLLAAMGIGALVSAVLIASAGDRLPRGMLMLVSVALYGFILMIFAASAWFPLSLVVIGIAGLCHVHSNALVQTVIQSYSPAEFRGRTMALFNMNRVFITVGSMLVGMLSLLWGTRWAVAAMGLAGALTIIAVAVLEPRARLIR